MVLTEKAKTVPVVLTSPHRLVRGNLANGPYGAKIINLPSPILFRKHQRAFHPLTANTSP
jgi:hypothetical protein